MDAKRSGYNGPERASSDRVSERDGAASPDAGGLQQVLSIVRAARACDSLACPRCADSRVQRWGSFSRRRRYRCRGCGRTFSDFTGTPIAYSKRAGLWEAYCDCMTAGLSVRRAAAKLGIHKDTAFRWRHRLLARLSQEQPKALTGLIDVDTVYFRYSEKGSRTRSAERATSSRSWRPPEQDRVYALLARDREGTTVAEVACRGYLSSGVVEEVLRPVLSGVGGLVCRPGPCSKYGVACRRMRLAFHWTRSAESKATQQAAQHFANVVQYRLRLKRWLCRFRGVATKYLAHYLRWHTWLDTFGSLSVANVASGPRQRLPVRQQFPRTESYGLARDYPAGSPAASMPPGAGPPPERRGPWAA